MQIQKINKERYNKHVKITFFAICIFMLLTSLTISTLLIQSVGSSDGSNFWLNVAGVIAAAVALVFILKHYKQHPFLTEVVYVRELKSHMNRIYRKQNKLKAAAQTGDKTAISILDYSYRASRYVYELDNNTLTISELTQAHNELLALAEKYQVEDFQTFNVDMLAGY